MSETSPVFPQSGQLDWVALARTPMTYSVEVMARLANAAIDPLTVHASLAIFSSISFPPSGQAELTESLSHLKGCSSYGKVLWFGLGVRHIVKCFLNPPRTTPFEDPPQQNPWLQLWLLSATFQRDEPLALHSLVDWSVPG
ncbi:hypothetical protein DL765_000162 [Monosporascus sp. GIB2]|nr:hypothetical protein DL765_000162 [Monosporascus sp. GIB2]